MDHATPTETVTITIDGQQAIVESGSTILDACNALGIRVPTLCFYRHIAPYAACRVCTVEMKRGKRHRMVTACNYPVEEGIEVWTNNERVLSSRRVNVELLLARHHKAKRVRELADSLGITHSRFGEEHQECILCGLCVRVCAEVVGAHALTFVGRGTNRRVATAPLEEDSTCISCGTCTSVCPTGAIRMVPLSGHKVHHRELFFGPNKAIAVPSMQAVPNVPYIHAESCIHFKTGGCQICEKVCPHGAVDHKMEDSEVELEAGAIIVSTGMKTFDPQVLPQYGFGVYPDVITSLEFERMSNASGPTGGRILLADGTEPRSVAILHCIGSRDTNTNAYCSKVCCMYSMKIAHLVREKVHAGVHEFYIDIRAAGKGYEEFYHRNLEEGVNFVRGKGAEILDLPERPEEEGKLVVRCEDTLLGVVRRVPVDMVILAVGLEPTADAKSIAQTLRISRSPDGFFLEKHPKLAPVSTASDGIFIAGACQGPKDIPDSVAQGGGAAAQALALIDRGYVEVEPTIAHVNGELCSGCRTCISMCPYKSIRFDEEKDHAVVEEALCKGCGTCVAACPSAAISQFGFTDDQVFAEIEGAMMLVESGFVAFERGERGVEAVDVRAL